ncbi:MAG: RNase H family protein [Ferruginibacter sp.]
MRNNFTSGEISVYTDGSCHTQKRMGAWVAILLFDNKEIILRENESNTTHNRMELTAVIKAVEYIAEHMPGDIHIKVFTDSQYVVGLPLRAAKLSVDHFITKKGNDLQNADLVKVMIALLSRHSIYLNKVKAHQKKTGTMNYNIVADKISRSMTREAVLHGNK